MNLTYSPLTRGNLEWARQLHNDPEVLSMLNDPTEVDFAHQLLWFEKLIHSSTSQRIVVKDNENLIGLIRIDQLDLINKSVCIGLDISKEFRGQGYAKHIYTDMFHLFFNEQKLNRIWLLTAEFNKRAIHLYTSLGFQVEGIQRQALYREGKYHNCIYMSILKDEYEIPVI